MNANRIALIFVNVLLFVPTNPMSAQTIHVSLRDRSVEGKPLYWNDDVIAIIASDGQLVTFSPNEAESFRKVSSTFRSESQASLRGALLKEFGQGFDVSGTGQYLVVHPQGQRDQWAERFEQLYRSMQHYLRVRRFPIRASEFPLVAVVFPTKQAYLLDSQKRGDNVSSNTLGYYDTVTNRIYMYDSTAIYGGQWYINAETIIHEAAHQTAFNTGIHNRLGKDPRWVVEGLGTLFEARGIWDSRSFPQVSDRVNAMQLEYVRRVLANTDSVELLQRQLASDRLFAQNPGVAYAHAWALTFYLTERESVRYVDYVKRLNQRDPFASYGAEDRLRDFMTVFGSDLRMFDARLKRFLEQL